MTNDLLIQGIVVGCYLLMLAVLGYAGWVRTQRGSEDYYVAGRGQGWIVTSLTISATYFSSLAVLGIPGLYHQQGMGVVSTVLVTMFAGIMVPVLGTPIWKAGKRSGFVTQAEMFADHFGGNAIRLAVSGVGAAYCVTYVVMQIMAGGYIFQHLFSSLEASTGLNAFYVGTTVLAAVTAAYTIFGGMKSVAWTDAIQGLLLLGGMFGTSVIVMLWIGSPATIFADVSQRDPSRLSLPGPQGAFPVSIAFTLSIGFAFGNMLQPAQWMRFYSAAGPKVLGRSAIVVGVLLTAIMLLTAPVVGLGGWLEYPDLPAADADSLVLKIIDDVPTEHVAVIPGLSRLWPILSGIFLTAIMAASMSTADSNLHAMSAMLARDVYRPFWRPAATETQLVQAGRIGVIILTGIAVTIVLLGSTDAIAFIAFLAVSFALQLLPATLDMLFIQRGSRSGAVMGLTAGVVALIVFSGPPLLIQWLPTMGELKNYLGIHFGCWGLIINSLVFVSITLISGKPPRSP
ncbi:MAG: sodium:solute symporter family protein [Planctomycetota bacterium]